ncbi:MAG TPA: transposase, partial [Chloroflexota bacterium]|nr:transposase [Chloroflexota bacterium]
MRPPSWHPPVELSALEGSIVKRIKRAKLFTFLRRVRHELFSDAFQEELATLYAASPLGQPPVPPAKLALATIVQAYVGASDDEVIEALTMDRRWQLVLDCLGCEQAPFGKATLQRFRDNLRAANLDRRLIERTVEMAENDRGVSPRQLRAALDSSPLWGAGRVEDTDNLLGHALRKASGVIARQQGRGLAEVATERGAPILGGPSLKAALDLDWDAPDQRQRALGLVLGALQAVETSLAEHPEVASAPEVHEPGQASLAVAHRVQAQDVEVGASGQPTLRKGGAKDRLVSVEDPAMRQGRKSRSQRFAGFKRHVLRDLDRGLIRAVARTGANVPDARAAEEIKTDLEPQKVVLRELHIDRAYLTSTLVRDRLSETAIYCKPWPVRNGGQFPKTAFALDWQKQTISCPNEITVPFEVGGVVHFPPETCATCSLRERCTRSKGQGRSVSIHPDAQLLAELRERQLPPLGRAKLRERVKVEHALA